MQYMKIYVFKGEINATKSENNSYCMTNKRETVAREIHIETHEEIRTEINEK